METIELRKAVETLLFIADQPVPLTRLCQIVGEDDSDKVSGVVTELKREYDEQGRGIQVVEIAEGFQMATRTEGAPFVRKLYSEKMTMRLSTAALETLSIVAYRQPITRAEIEEVRGVEVIAAIESLLDKRLVKVVGRKETVGRPLLYGTTPEFLRHFGLRSIEDLPPLDTFKPAESVTADGTAVTLAAEANSVQMPTVDQDGPVEAIVADTADVSDANVGAEPAAAETGLAAAMMTEVSAAMDAPPVASDAPAVESSADLSEEAPDAQENPPVEPEPKTETDESSEPQ